MSGEELPRSMLAECRLSASSDFRLCAANIGEQSIWGEVRRQLRDQIDNSAHWNREHDHIAAARGFNWIDYSSGDRSNPLGAGQYRFLIAANDLPAKTILPERKPQRSTNQASADDRDLAKAKRLNHGEIESLNHRGIESLQRSY